MDDAWLALAERFFVGAPKEDKYDALINKVKIKLSEEEREHFSLLEEMVPNLEAILGPRCMTLLRSGYGVATDGLLMNLFAPDYPAQVMRHLLRTLT